ncbi:diacylglycerol kinase family protein [Enhygromyxa salina]|uniref:DAGKc domain-containing protein n=1 Tax=Enhygromyxa salina TaxID=215803 RepID=A0A2S9XL46_9BACT|nr:diacylglycerol kinase family protein [Enhygromyxa salina]PRP93585.1 hypothetical protein ENSA7_80130 [Enhygromyxa salina]
MEAFTEILDRHLLQAPELVLVLNPNAGRVRKRMARSATATAVLNPRLHLTSSLDELTELFRTKPVDASQTVCFYGGDGSIARGLSAMLACLGEDAPLPTILPVAAGTINVMGEYLGLSEPPFETLGRMAERGELVRRSIPSLKVEVEGHAPIYGFMFGWGVIYRVLEAYYARREHPTIADATLVMAQTFAQSLNPNAMDTPLFSRRGLRLCVDGEDLGPSQPALHSLIVGVLERSTMGLRALPPEPIRAHRFHISGNGMRPAVVFRHSLMLLFGQGDQRELAVEHPLVARANIGELGLELTEGYTLDGEMIALEGARACRISAGPIIPFWAAPEA